jgi:hypothetical protein
MSNGDILKRPRGRPPFTLEERVASIERKLESWYQRMYASQMRKDRKNLQPAINSTISRMRHFENRFGQYAEDLRRLGIQMRKRPKRSISVYLTPSEFIKFRCWLKTDMRIWNRTGDK